MALARENPEQTERVAIIIARVVYRPSPDMSGDIWKSLGEGVHKRMLRCAEDVLNEIHNPDC